MQFIRKLSSTSNVFRVALKNSSTGAGLTGLTFSSTGLIVSTICDNEATATAYTVAGSTIETITTLGTYAAPTATKCRFKEVDATNHPGLYELQFADARFAVASAKILRVTLSGATSLLTKDVTIQLSSVDPDSAATFMTGVNGITPPSNWNLMAIDGSGRIDLGKVLGSAPNALQSGRFDSYVGAYATGLDPATYVLVTPANKLATDASGRVTVGSNADKTGYGVSSLNSGVITASSIGGGALNGKGDWLLATSAPTRFSSLAIDVSGRIDLGLWLGAAPNTLISGRVDANTQATAATLVFNQTGNVSGTIGGYASGQDPATLVLDALMASHVTANTVGAKINAAGNAGDPWTTTLPGGYVSGSAGYKLGNLTSGGAGSGAWQQIIHVTDGASALGGVTVRIYAGATNASGTTDISGNVTLNVDTGTYTLSATKGGYTYTPSTLSVSANATTNIAMTLVGIASPPGSSQCTATGVLWDATGALVLAGTVEYRLHDTSPTTGIIVDQDVRTSVSHVTTGVVSITGIQGKTYDLRYKNGAWYSYTFPNAATHANGLTATLGKLMGGN